MCVYDCLCVLYVCLCACMCVYMQVHVCVAHLNCHISLLQEVFDALFSKEEHDRRLERGDVRLSYKAMQGALMVFLYRYTYSFTSVTTLM